MTAQATTHPTSPPAPTPPRIAIVGPGAIGGLFGMRLLLSGTPVTFIAHGASLAAIKAEGLTLVEVDGVAHHRADISVTDSMVEAGPQDVVLLTVKAQQVGPLAADLHAMVGPQTIVVTMENGLPWWYFCGGYGGDLAGTRLESVDPGGRIAAHLDPACVIGAVEYVAAHHPSPTRIEADGGSKIIIGELDGARSARIERLAGLLAKAGFDVSITPDIRGEVWRKLLVNASFNPVSALTHATIGEICRMPECRRLILDLMGEAEAVAQATGIGIEVSPETRLAAIELFGAHKTSMLQDVESGHPAEVEALVGAVIELGRLTGVATPRLQAVCALVKLLEGVLTARCGRLAIRPGIPA